MSAQSQRWEPVNQAVRMMFHPRFDDEFNFVPSQFAVAFLHDQNVLVHWHVGICVATDGDDCIFAVASGLRLSTGFNL